MRILLLVLVGVAWVGVPGALIGWIAGFFGWHMVAAVLWGLFIMYTYPRSKRRWGGKVDALTYFLAFVQAGMGGLVTFFVGQVTHYGNGSPDEGNWGPGGPKGPVICYVDYLMCNGRLLF